MLTKIKAKVPISDGGHRLAPGQIDDVLSSFARLWISLGWAEEIKRRKKGADDDQLR